MKFYVELEISDNAFKLLKEIEKAGSVEYRDTEYPTLGDFKESVANDGSATKRSDEWFLGRNFGGTYYLIDELLTNNLIESDTESWHETYKLSDFGKKVLSKQVFRNSKLISLTMLEESDEPR